MCSKHKSRSLFISGRGVSCPLAGAVELFHQTRAASETLSALLGGDSVKRLSFVRFMTMETTSTLFILTHTVGD